MRGHGRCGLGIGFSEPGLNDNPPPPFDARFCWPPEAGYVNGIGEMRYADAGVWRDLPATSASLGMHADEITAVPGGNMLRVAQEVWSNDRAPARPCYAIGA